jgi:hypothetical protein
VITSGRSRTDETGLLQDTLVVALRKAFDTELRHERARIVELAHRPVAVGALAAGLGVPIGVAVILLADLLAEHLVAVAADDDRVTQSLIERIRDRVRAL